MSYRLHGLHRNSYYFPGQPMVGIYARGVSEDLIEDTIAQAEKAGWFDLLAIREAF